MRCQNAWYMHVRVKNRSWDRLGQQIFVYQAEEYAILQIARNFNLKPQRKEWIRILTDSQAALSALTNLKVTCLLVWE